MRGGRFELVDRLEAAQAFHLKAEQASDSGCFRRCDQHCGAGVVQDARLAPQMLFDPRHTRRRIYRARDSTRVEDAEEGREEGLACRQHDGHAFAGLQATLLQAERDGARPLAHLPVAQRAFAAVAFQHHDMNAFAVLPNMPVEHLGQRRGRIRGGVRRLRRGRVAGRDLRNGR